MGLTAKEAANKIVAHLPENEKDDAVIAETRRGDYFIITDYRIFEVYESAGTLWTQYKELSRQGWTDLDADMDSLKIALEL